MLQVTNGKSGSSQFFQWQKTKIVLQVENCFDSPEKEVKQHFQDDC